MPETVTATATAGLALAVPPIYQPGLEGLREAWFARLRPGDPAERAAADAFVAQVWLTHRLDAVEERLLGALIEGRPIDGLPSLATLVRARARRERDRDHALSELERAQRTPRAPLPEPLDSQAEPEPAAGWRPSEPAEQTEIFEKTGIPGKTEIQQPVEIAEHEAPEPAVEVAAAAAVRATHVAPEPGHEVALAALGSSAHTAPEPFTALPAHAPVGPGHAPHASTVAAVAHAAPEEAAIGWPYSPHLGEPARVRSPLRAAG